MSAAPLLQATQGQIALRLERADDADFLHALFRSHALVELAALPVDAATREALVGMQFASQTQTYREQFPDARFAIVECDGAPIGRLIVDDDGAAACIVDFALLPASRSGGLGTAIMRAVLAGLTDPPRIVRCKVLCNNEPSLRMCQRVGFVHIGGDLPFMQLEWRPAAPL